MIRFITCMSAAALGLAASVGAPSADATAATKCTPDRRASATCGKQRQQARKPAKPTRGHPRKEAKPKKPVDPHAPALDATTLACNLEYETNKAAIDGGGQSKAKFIKDCKNGSETIPSGGTTAAAPPPAVDGPPPDKPLPPASLTSGRPLASKDGDTVTGTTKPDKPKLK